MLKELISLDISQPTPFSGWRASSVGECETFLCHDKLGHESLPFSGRVRHLLDDGLVHERDIVNRLIDKGIPVLYGYNEGQLDLTPYKDEKLAVSGHSDGIVDASGLVDMHLDFFEHGFKFNQHYYLLEVTARSGFQFMKLLRQHMREVLWVKYVQIQFYLNDEKIRRYGDNCICVVKNKANSELYEEGISFHPEIIAETVKKLKYVDEMVAGNEVSSYRCSDWRKMYCRYKELCLIPGSGGRR